jgi:hypothetical protein
LGQEANQLIHLSTNNILGFCLGENHWCDYIEDNLSFLCVVAGFNATELTPKYPDFIKERVYAYIGVSGVIILLTNG